MRYSFLGIVNLSRYVKRYGCDWTFTQLLIFVYWNYSIGFCIHFVIVDNFQEHIHCCCCFEILLPVYVFFLLFNFFKFFYSFLSFHRFLCCTQCQISSQINWIVTKLFNKLTNDFGNFSRCWTNSNI